LFAGCASRLATLNPKLAELNEIPMRAETQKLVEEIKQSMSLLRRHL